MYVYIFIYRVGSDLMAGTGPLDRDQIRAWELGSQFWLKPFWLKTYFGSSFRSGFSRTLK